MHPPLVAQPVTLQLWLTSLCCLQKTFDEQQRQAYQQQIEAKAERVALMEQRRAQLVQLLALRRKSVQHQDDLMQASQLSAGG